MSDDRRTKAQLVAELERAEREASELRARVPVSPARVPEADALADCIRALDGIKSGQSYSYGSKDPHAVRRTILALCEKYGIQREERVTEPCERRHVEDMNAVDVISAVRRDFEGMSFR